MATPSRFPARLEHLPLVTSTNDVVAGWLRAGVPEVCVAVADEQSAGRGRLGRSWTAPAGAGLLVSIGFRPTWLPPDRWWRLSGITALAMADAAEDVAGLPEGVVRLKWPNDLVVAFRAVMDDSDRADLADRPIGGAAVLPSTPLRIRKLAGLLGESDGIGTSDPRVVVGIGVNADWAAADFPPELADDMTSLRVASGGRPIDREVLLSAFLDRLETRYEALREGHFDVAGWAERQLTSGRRVRLEHPDGRAELVRAVGVDALTGALLVAGDAEAAGSGTAAAGGTAAERQVLVGEIRHVRLDDPAGAAV